MYGENDPLKQETLSFKIKLDEAGIENVIFCCKGLLYGTHAAAMCVKFKKGKRYLNSAVDFAKKHLE